MKLIDYLIFSATFSQGVKKISFLQKEKKGKMCLKGKERKLEMAGGEERDLACRKTGKFIIFKLQITQGYDPHDYTPFSNLFSTAICKNYVVCIIGNGGRFCKNNFA